MLAANEVDHLKAPAILWGALDQHLLLGANELHGPRRVLTGGHGGRTSVGPSVDNRGTGLIVTQRTSVAPSRPAAEFGFIDIRSNTGKPYPVIRNSHGCGH